MRTWRTWRSGVIGDDAAVDLKPGGGVSDNIIATHSPAIAVRAFGKTTNNDSATIELVGRMSEQSNWKDGPGQSLLRFELRLGSKSFSSIAPLKDGKWGDPSDWREVRVWDGKDSLDGYHNAARIVSVKGSDQIVVLVLLYGYTHIEAIFTLVGGGGTEMTEVGLLYREISHQDAIGLIKAL